jgi:hypothetical protein
MSEMEILGLVGASVLTAGMTWLFAMMRINKMNAPTPTVQLETVDSAFKQDRLSDALTHVHEASHANPGGWFCDCGLHKHIYCMPIKDEMRCQCGKEGIGKEWA